MSTHIDKTDTERWFAIINGPGEAGLVLFGWAFPVGTSVLESGQPSIVTYLTERELETYIDTETGIEDYYRTAVETSSPFFQGVNRKTISTIFLLKVCFVGCD